MGDRMTRERLEELLTEGLRDSDLIEHLREVTAERDEARAAIDRVRALVEDVRFSSNPMDYMQAVGDVLAALDPEEAR